MVDTQEVPTKTQGRRERPRREKPFHPLLIAAYPVLFLYQANVDEVTIGQAMTPLILSVVGAAIIYTLAGLVLRGLGRAALATTTFIFFFYSYGHIKNLLGDAAVGPIVLATERVLVPSLGLLFLLIMWRVLRARKTRNTNVILNIVSVVLILMSVTTLASGGGVSAAATVTAGPPVLEPLPPQELKKARDIYYLVFDRYTSNRLLKELYGFDNSPFLNDLRARGFQVTEDSRANYVNTVESLASSLNFEHLGPLAKDEPGDSWSAALQLLKHHRAGRSLQAAGYEYHHLGSWSEMSRLSPNADRNYIANAESEFNHVLLRTTAWRAAAKGLGIRFRGRRQEQRENALSQFEDLSAIAKAKSDKPRFVFAHVLVPHPPYVFDSKGDRVTAKQQRARPRKVNYIDQMKFTNTKLRALMDVLLDGPEESDPIIIFQADEGMYPKRWLAENERYARRSSTPNQTPLERREKYGIVNAIYLPGADVKITETFTPVNNFRLLFNTYFGTKLPMRPDRQYLFTAPDKRYDFIDITKELGKPGG